MANIIRRGQSPEEIRAGRERQAAITAPKQESGGAVRVTVGGVNRIIEPGDPRFKEGTVSVSYEQAQAIAAKDAQVKAVQEAIHAPKPSQTTVTVGGVQVPIRTLYKISYADTLQPVGSPERLTRVNIDTGMVTKEPYVSGQPTYNELPRGLPKHLEQEKPLYPGSPEYFSFETQLAQKEAYEKDIAEGKIVSESRARAAFAGGRSIEYLEAMSAYDKFMASLNKPRTATKEEMRVRPDYGAPYALGYTPKETSLKQRMVEYESVKSPEGMPMVFRSITYEQQAPTAREAVQAAEKAGKEAYTAYETERDAPLGYFEAREGVKGKVNVVELPLIGDIAVPKETPQTKVFLPFAPYADIKTPKVKEKTVYFGGVQEIAFWDATLFAGVAFKPASYALKTAYGTTSYVGMRGLTLAREAGVGGKAMFSVARTEFANLPIVKSAGAEFAGLRMGAKLRIEGIKLPKEPIKSEIGGDIVALQSERLLARSTRRLGITKSEPNLSAAMKTTFNLHPPKKIAEIQMPNAKIRVSEPSVALAASKSLARGFVLPTEELNLAQAIKTTFTLRKIPGKTTVIRTAPEHLFASKTPSDVEGLFRGMGRRFRTPAEEIDFSQAFSTMFKTRELPGKFSARYMPKDYAPPGTPRYKLTAFQKKPSVPTDLSKQMQYVFGARKLPRRMSYSVRVEKPTVDFSMSAKGQWMKTQMKLGGKPKVTDFSQRIRTVFGGGDVAPALPATKPLENFGRTERLIYGIPPERITYALGETSPSLIQKGRGVLSTQFYNLNRIATRLKQGYRTARYGSVRSERLPFKIPKETARLRQYSYRSGKNAPEMVQVQRSAPQEYQPPRFVGLYVYDKPFSYSEEKIVVVEEPPKRRFEEYGKKSSISGITGQWYEFTEKYAVKEGQGISSKTLRTVMEPGKTNARENDIATVRTDSLGRVSESTSTLPRIGQIPGTATGTRTGTGTGTKLKYKYPEEPIFPIIPKESTVEFSGRKLHLSKSLSFKAPTHYAPSFTAILEGVTGKAPKAQGRAKTGFEFRPIVIQPAGKKRAGKGFFGGFEP
jgi:hypothetical protein